MIGKVGKGNRVIGLLRYLFGPGRANEHVAPHLIASWDGCPHTLEPEVGADGKRHVARLAGLLDQPLALLSRPPAHSVWHCSLRAAPADRSLTDDEWARIAEELLDQTGLARRGDGAGCRWVAVRHGDDHVHVVVTLARQDGRRPSLSHDFHKVGALCQWAERRYHLTETASRDRTAARRATRAETEKAKREGRAEPSRPVLRRRVRSCAAAATGPADFLRRLEAAGLLVRLRYSSRTPGEVTGYAVAIPGDRTTAGQPVWFGGGKLAADLAWPQLTCRWTSPTPPTPPTTADDRARTWNRAVTAADANTRDIRYWTGVDPARAAGAAHATADIITATAHIVEGRTSGPLTEAAEAFDRAARLPYARRPQPSSHAAQLRAAAVLIVALGRLASGEHAQLAAVLHALGRLIDAVADLRSAERHHAQAAAARDSARLLRAEAARRACLTPAQPTLTAARRPPTSLRTR